MFLVRSGVPAKRPRRGAAQSIPFEEHREEQILPAHHMGKQDRPGPFLVVRDLTHTVRTNEQPGHH